MTFHSDTGYQTGTYPVHRPGETVLVNGRAVRPSPTVLLMDADIQPLSGRLLRSVPEGVNTEDVRVVFTDFELLVGIKSDGLNKGREPDLVIVDGEPWRVIRVAHHNVISGHYQATIERRWHS